MSAPPQEIAGLGQPDRKEDIRLAREEMQSLARFGDTIIGTYGVSTGFHEGSMPSHFSHDPYPRISLNLEFLAQAGTTRGQRAFVLGHELLHYGQYLEDPQTYKKTFKITEEKAARNPKLKQAWDRFFNIFLDIHGNTKVVKRSTRFQKGEPDENEPRNLYAQRLFRKNDYRGDPLSIQFVNGLMRRIMVPDEEIILDPEVAELLARPVVYMRQTYASMEDFVRQRMCRQDGQYKFSNFYFDLTHVPMQEFEKLLQADRQSGRLDAYNFPSQFGMNAADPDTFADIDEFAVDRHLPAGDRARNRRGKALKGKLAGEGYTEDEIKEILEREVRTQAVAETMAELYWEMVQKNTEYGWESFAPVKHGTRINLPALQRNIPRLLTDPNSAEIMERNRLTPKETQVRPKRIIVVDALDMSGSMFSPKAKLEATTDTCYADGKSLILFTDEGKTNNDSFPIQTELHIIPYGEGADEEFFHEKISDNPSASEDNLRKRMEGLRSLGGTYAADAMRVAEDIFRPYAGMNRDDVLLIYFDITDGQTLNPEESQERKKRLNAMGVYTKAIQIESGYARIPRPKREPKEGEPEEPKDPEEEIEERYRGIDTFDMIWKKDGKRLPQMDIKKLLEVKRQLLQEILTERTNATA